MTAPDAEPVNPAVASLRMLLDDEPATFRHGRLPSLEWRESAWQRNERTSRFVRVLRNAWRRA